MAGAYHRLTPQQTLVANQTQPASEVYDAGAFNHLQLQGRVLKAGTAGKLKLQHAAVNEPDAFIDVSGAEWDLDQAGPSGNVFITVDDFLRYLRWITDANVLGSPIALLDLIAKE